MMEFAVVSSRVTRPIAVYVGASTSELKKKRSLEERRGARREKNLSGLRARMPPIN